MRRALSALLVLAAVSPPIHARQDAKAADLRGRLGDRLNAVADGLDGVMGFAIAGLESDERFERLANEVFPTASTIKLAILYELFRQADEGRIQLDERKVLDPASAVGGTGILAELTTPALSIRDHATLMIVLSDNTATNVLIDALGIGAVTRRMASLGLTHTRLRRKMLDLDAARRGDENVSTPAELARLLAVIYRGEGLSERSREGLATILRKPKGSPMRSAIPDEVAVANKPGTLEGVEVDAGIVFVKGRPYAQAMMTTYLKDNAAGEAAIRTASRAAFEYFSRLARSSEYGRAIR